MFFKIIVKYILRVHSIIFLFKIFLVKVFFLNIFWKITLSNILFFLKKAFLKLKMFFKNNIKWILNS